MADTQMRGTNKRNSVADDNDNEIFMITVGKLVRWSSTDRDKNRKSTEN